MKKQAAYLKKILTVPFLFLMIIVSFFILSVRFLKVETTTAFEPQSITFTDPNFKSPSGYTYPMTPSGFTASTSSELNIKKGVIDLSKMTADNKKNCDLQDSDIPPYNPNSTDKNVLMINSKNASNKFSYSSNELSLKANSYYIISVDVFAKQPVANIYLTDTKSELNKSLKIENINSTSWETYTLMVATPFERSMTAKLELSLNGKGIAYFDNIIGHQVTSESWHKTVTNMGSQSNYKYFDMKTTPIESFEFSDSNYGMFIPDAANSSNMDNIDITDYGVFNITGESVMLTNGAIIPSSGTNLMPSHQNSLVIDNKENAATAFKSDEYELLAGRIYRFTIYAKAMDVENGTAVIRLNEVVEDEDDKEKAITSQFSFSTTTNAVTNGYAPFTFYVKNSSIIDKKVTFDLKLGSLTQKAKGKLFVSGYEITLVSNTDFLNISEGDYVKKVDFASYSDTTGITNSSFNMYSNDIVDITKSIYPGQPDSWTHTAQNSDNTINGVVTTTDYNSYKNNFTNLYAIPSNSSTESGVRNNVLLMGNYTENIQSYTSSSVSLDAKTVYKFEILVHTQIWNGSKNGASIIFKDSNGNVIYIIDDIKTRSDLWTNCIFYFKTGMESMSLNIELSLGNSKKTASGYAVFDNIKNGTATQTTFDAKINNLIFSDRVKEYLVDLEKDTFTHFETKYNSKFYEPLLYTGELLAGDNGATGGIYNTDEYKTGDLPSNPAHAANNKILVISSGADTAYTYTGKLQYTFNSGSYYKVTIDVYTHGLRQASDNINFNDKDEVIPYGATLSVSNFEKTFNGINTNGKWETYTFYLAPSTTSTCSTSMGLGALDAKTAGLAYFTSPVITQFESETQYKAALGAYGDNLPKNVLATTTVEPDEEDENEDTNKPTADLLLISSLITGLAILIAIIGVALRKFKYKKLFTRKKYKTEYDRTTTLSRQVYINEATEHRNKTAAEIKAEIDTLQAQKHELEEDYKKSLATLRSLNLKQDSSANREISSITKSISKTNKMLNKIAKQLSDLDITLTNVLSDQYLFELTNELERKGKAVIISDEQQK